MEITPVRIFKATDPPALAHEYFTVAELREEFDEEVHFVRDFVEQTGE